MRVAVLGGGYAGLTAARQLEGALPDHAELLVVDESGQHLVQHELHRVIRRPTLAEDIRFPLAEVLDRGDVLTDRVTALEPAEDRVTLADRGPIEFDACVVALGAETAFYDLPGLRDNATPLKRVEHARAIRRRVDPVLGEDGRIVVGGAGLAGVQVAGELAAMNRERGTDATVVLLEQRESVVPTFPDTFQRAVRDALDARAVEIRTGCSVTGAEGESIALAGDSDVHYEALIWTGGIRGPAALAGDRPEVRSDLRLAGRTFAAGDAARVIDDRGRAVPASARTAIGQARVAATNAARVLEEDATDGFGPQLERYVDADAGWIVSVGDGAVAQVGTSVLTGTAALALKTSVGAGYLGRVGAITQAVDLVRAELGQRGDTQGEHDRAAPE